jgi:hypothetical protein
MDTKIINLSNDIEMVEILSSPINFTTSVNNKLYTFITDYFNMLDIYLHLYGIMMFEIFFYLYYIVQIEKSKVINMIEEFADYSMNLIRSKIELSSLNTYIIELADNPICKSLTTKYQTIQNSKIIQACFNFIYFLNIFLVLLTTFHICIYRSPRKLCKSFIKTVFFLILCGIFEYFFFISIVMNYKILSTDESLCYFLNKIK